MSQGSATQVGVIGGGLGGLAAACTLAARGYKVVLFEKNPWLGGKAAVLEGDGFRFDMGPTILTLPSVLARIFKEAGRDIQEELELIPLDPQWRCFFEDGSTLDLHADSDRMERALEGFSDNPRASAEYHRFIQFSKNLHEISNRYFFWRPIGSILDTFDFGTSFKPSVLTDLVRMRPGQSVAGAIRSHVSDARVAQMLDHFTQYVGSAPDASPAVLCGIAHMQTGEGVWYPRGGTGAVPRVLKKLAEELGVVIRTDTEVRRIRVENHKVTGVETDAAEFIPLGAIISNSDAIRTYQDLLTGKAVRRFAPPSNHEPACSGVVLYLGLDRCFNHLLHHNSVFSKDPEEEFDAIYKQGEPASDPSCYLCAPSKTESDVAPPGKEALYVLVHTPYLRSHHNWKTMFPAYRSLILQKLARTAGLEDLERHIVFEQTLTPEDIHERYRVLNGAIYGLASHGRFLGAFKPSNRCRNIEGLYLAGGAAHPGPGMPMVLMSGWIAADALDRDKLVLTSSLSSENREAHLSANGRS